MASVRRDRDCVESRLEKESRRWMSCSVSSATASASDSASEGEGRGEGKSEVDRYLVVRKVSVRVKREGSAEWEREAGCRFKGTEMGSGSKVER